MINVRRSSRLRGEASVEQQTITTEAADRELIMPEQIPYADVLTGDRTAVPNEISTKGEEEAVNNAELAERGVAEAGKEGDEKKRTRNTTMKRKTTMTTMMMKTTSWTRTTMKRMTRMQSKREKMRQSIGHRNSQMIK